MVKFKESEKRISVFIVIIFVAAFGLLLMLNGCAKSKESLKLDMKGKSISFPCTIEKVLKDGIKVKYSTIDGGSASYQELEKKDLLNTNIMDAISRGGYIWLTLPGEEDDWGVYKGIDDTYVKAFIRDENIIGCELTRVPQYVYAASNDNHSVKYGDLHIDMSLNDLTSVLGEEYYYVYSSDSYIWNSSMYGVVAASFYGEDLCETISLNEHDSEYYSDARIIWSAILEDEKKENYQFGRNVDSAIKQPVKEMMDSFVDGINNNNFAMFESAFEWEKDYIAAWDEFCDEDIAGYYIAYMNQNKDDEYGGDGIFLVIKNSKGFIIENLHCYIRVKNGIGKIYTYHGRHPYGDTTVYRR